MARRRSANSRRYPRTARLNEVVREIVAEELERIDDERLGFFTVTAVEVDPGLEHARVHWTDLGAEDDVVLAVLDEHRTRLQAAVNRQTHLRRTPVLSFHADEVSRSASRIDDLLDSLTSTSAEPDETSEPRDPDESSNKGDPDGTSEPRDPDETSGTGETDGSAGPDEAASDDGPGDDVAAPGATSSEG